MNKFTNGEHIAYKLMIKHDAWINTALLSALLLSAFLKQQPANLEIFLLFFTWSINRAQRRELGWNYKVLFSVLNAVQLLIMLYAAMSVLEILSHIVR